MDQSSLIVECSPFTIDGVGISFCDFGRLAYSLKKLANHMHVPIFRNGCEFLVIFHDSEIGAVIVETMFIEGNPWSDSDDVSKSDAFRVINTNSWLNVMCSQETDLEKLKKFFDEILPKGVQVEIFD